MNVYHNQSDIEDLCNDVLLKFSSDSYKSFESIRSIESIDGWLYVLVKNFVTSHVRQQIRSDHSQRHFINEQATAYINEPVFKFLHEEQKKFLLQSLETLDTQERLVLTMYNLDHLKY